MSGDPLALDRRVSALEERDRADAVNAATVAETVRQLGLIVVGLQSTVHELSSIVESMRGGAAARRYLGNLGVGVAGALIALYGSGAL